MLHLACCAFKKLFVKSRGTKTKHRAGVLPWLSALERQIPYIMAQPLAAFLEAGRVALGWPRHERSVRPEVVQTGVRVQYLQHSIRIGLPVGGKTQHTAGAQPVGNQLDEGPLYQPPFVVPLLRPGVR